MRTVKISERIERAVQQRLFLVDVSAPTTCPDNGGLLVKLRVLGSTGKYRILMSALYLKSSYTLADVLLWCIHRVNACILFLYVDS